MSPHCPLRKGTNRTIIRPNRDNLVLDNSLNKARYFIGGGIGGVGPLDSHDGNIMTRRRVPTPPKNIVEGPEIRQMT